MLLFAPQSLVGEQAPPKPEAKATPGLAATTIPTTITDTLRVQTLQVAGGAPVGYLRIWAFDTDPDQFIQELLRLIPLLPPDGLVIDVRGNPGGYILAAELALQLFTPKPIQPTRFSVLATPFTRDMAAVASLAQELAPWKPSLIAAVRNGELYSQPIPVSEPADCNAIGQRYPGPVVLVGDSTTYSRGTCSRPASSTTAWGRSSASAKPPVPAVPTSGTTRSCARRWPARTWRCRR